MRNKSGEIFRNARRASAPLLSRLAEPALLVAALTAIAYWTGYTNRQFFCQRLGLSWSLLNDPSSSYLAESLYPLIVGIMATMVSLIGVRQRPRSILHAIRGNALFFVVSACLISLPLISGRSGLSNISGFTEFAVGIMMFAFSLYMSISGRASLAYFAATGGTLMRVGFITYACMSFTLLGGVAGLIEAERLLDGHGISIAFHYVEGQTMQGLPSNDSLMLIVHRDGKYLVLGKQKPDPICPKIYVIPDEMVKLAITQSAPPD